MSLVQGGFVLFSALGLLLQFTHKWTIELGT